MSSKVEDGERICDQASAVFALVDAGALISSFFLYHPRSFDKKDQYLWHCPDPDQSHPRCRIERAEDDLMTGLYQVVAEFIAM
jgi:hypothetical protein